MKIYSLNNFKLLDDIALKKRSEILGLIKIILKKVKFKMC